MLIFICKEIAAAQEAFSDGGMGLKIVHPRLAGNVYRILNRSGVLVTE